MAATDDYLEALYKGLYESELERSDKLDAQINLPTAVVTGLLAVSAFYIEHFPKLQRRIGVILFVLCLGAYGAFLVGAMYCLIRSYFNQKYKWLPSPGRVQQNVDQLREYYEALDDGLDVDERVKADIQHDMVNVYKQSGAFNRDTNVIRVGWLHWATRWIIASIVTLVISRSVYYLGVAESKPQELRITGLPDVQKVEVTGHNTQKVQVVGPPPVQRVEIVNPPASQKVEVTGLPDVQKVEVVTPKKENR